MILFIFGCAGSLLRCIGFPRVAANGGCSSLRCVSFSFRGLLLLGSTGSRALRLNGSGSWAELPLSIQHLPRPGVKPKSASLAGGFLTPREAQFCLLNIMSVETYSLYAFVYFSSK